MYKWALKDNAGAKEKKKFQTKCDSVRSVNPLLMMRQSMRPMRYETKLHRRREIELKFEAGTEIENKANIKVYCGTRVRIKKRDRNRKEKQYWE
ncbi:hypothetical protein EVAR_101921_1 [Eumeta japonica]|uniref:Uncharacterized protein n=1 Tax=Eumeta variegata TaxID=151549 RepID=A0A4C1TSC1_EUMVA|nr:hypothetical protein EVAR_101921_1 [Eumeta japonica]